MSNVQNEATVIDAVIIGQAAGLSSADVGLLIAASLFAVAWRPC